jgi:small redox-active disulfide protein 2
VKHIKILGGGCPKCQKLYEHAQSAVSNNSIEAEIEKITDMVTIMKYNILSTPALVIDDQVVSTGKVLSAEEISALL